MALDFFGFFLIDPSERAVCATLSVQQLIQLRLKCLRITMFGTLDEQCHEPYDQRGDRMPIKRFAVEDA